MDCGVYKEDSIVQRSEYLIQGYHESSKGYLRNRIYKPD